MTCFAYRYALEKAKYEETLKQEAPTSPPPVASPQDPTMAEGVTPLNGKKRKDHDAPKRPRTAYILFSMEFRKTLDSNINFNDGTKLVSITLNWYYAKKAAQHVDFDILQCPICCTWVYQQVHPMQVNLLS